jgi:NADP-dependent 3-hydroxy acid dehydrogenase YdfG
MPGIKDFRDKVVVITGGGSGIGRATALAFASEKSDVVIADKNEERLNNVADEIDHQGARCLPRKVDVSDRIQVEEFSKFVIKERGKVDILFNNAGVAIGGSFYDTSIEDFEWIFSINFWGVIYCIKSFLPHMISRKSGHIVNTSSLAGLCAAPGISAYCSTKFALAGLGESLRAELKRHGIGITTICPGIINTRIVADGRMHLKQDHRANTENVVNFYKRHGWPPERVAKSVLKAIRKNRSVVPVGPEAWFQWFGKRISQRAHDALAERIGRLLMG